MPPPRRLTADVASPKSTADLHRESSYPRMRSHVLGLAVSHLNDCSPAIPHRIASIIKATALTANVPQICGVSHLRLIYQSRASSLTDQTGVASARGATRRATCSQGKYACPPSDWDARRATLRRGAFTSGLSHANVPSPACCTVPTISSHSTASDVRPGDILRRPTVRKAFGHAATMSRWRKRALDPDLETVQPGIEGLRWLDVMRSCDIGDPQAALTISMHR